MKKYLFSGLKLVISLGAGIALVLWFLGRMSEGDKQNVIEDIRRADYFWVIIPPLIGLMSNYFRTERWRLLLRPLGYYPGFWNTFYSVMIMYFLNLFFPRLGEVSRCGILARYEKVPLDKAIGTMVLERVVDVVCLGLLAVFLLWIEQDKFLLLYQQIMADSQTTFSEIISKYEISANLKYSVFGIVISGLVLFLAIQVRKKGLPSLLASFKEKITGLIRGIISIKDISNPYLFLFHTLMIWVCYFLMGYLGFRIFPETSHLGFLAAGLVLFFASIAFSITPGGLGLYPIFVQIVLGLYGIVGSVALSLGLVIWSMQTASVLLAGVISLIILAITNRESALEQVTLKE
ncbi:MAG: flippase-like domain-containing protein [Bacteroidetes bacterium]|nr:flippase-like domain-containing protein [Bacteroidota bacterium]